MVFEGNKLITPVQCGWHKQRSTTDHLVHLEAFIWKAFVQRQHTVSFLYLEKAYESTWKFGIMRDLYNAGLHGRLSCFTECFLKVSCTTWCLHFWPVWSGNGCTTRLYPNSNFIWSLNQFSNKSYFSLCLVLFICWWFPYLLPLKTHPHNWTAFAAVSQQTVSLGRH